MCIYKFYNSNVVNANFFSLNNDSLDIYVVDSESSLAIIYTVNSILGTNINFIYSNERLEVFINREISNTICSNLHK